MDQQAFGTPTETVIRIPLDRITESPDNSRKTYSESGLDEMAASIISQDVQQPIVVRELTGRLYQYEIVFGHRRYRGSVRAKRPDIPAIVRQMTDEQADKARLHENLEREDLHYVEEAEALHRLMGEHGVTAAELMEQTGLKTNAFYGRLKLANLHPKVREACMAGIFGSEVATLIGRWPLAVQPKAMAACIQDFYGMDADEKGKHAKSYRECKRALKGLAVPIASADVSEADATLPGPDGTPLACASCSNNTANDGALSEHFGDEAQCIFRDCYDKREALLERRVVDEARADGRVVDRAVAASQPDLVSRYKWMGRDTVDSLLSQAEAKGIATPKPTLVLDGDKIGGSMYVKADIDAIRAQLFPESAAAPDQGDNRSDGPPSGHEGYAAWLSALPPEQQAVADRLQWERVQLALMKAARDAPRTAEELREFLLDELDSIEEFPGLAEQAIGWPPELDELDDPTEERKALIRGMEPADLAAFLVFIMISNLPGIHWHSDYDQREPRIKHRLALAQRYGVDVLQAAKPPASKPIDPQPGTASDGLRASEKGAAPSASKGGGGTVKYRNAMTGDAWSGRGLQPKWVKAALAAGRALAEFEVGGAVNQSDDGRIAAGRDAEVAA